MIKKVDATSGSLVKLIFIYTVPLIVSSILQNLFHISDKAVLGNMAGNAAVASIAATGTVTELIISTAIGLATGTSIVLARAVGQRNQAKIRETIDTSLVTSVGLGLVLAVIGFLLSPALLTVTKCPKECYDGALLYMRIYLAAAPATLLYNYGSAILRALGDTQRPLIYIMISGVVNVVLNVVLCLILPQKVAAVAIATVTSNVISAVLVLRRLCRLEDGARVSLFHLCFRARALGRILRFGIPSSITCLVHPIGNLQVITEINTYGAEILSGFSASVSVDTIPRSFGDGFGSATTVFMGQNLGANNSSRVKRSFWYILLINLLITGSLGLFLYLTGEFWIGLIIGRASTVAIEHGVIRSFYVTLFMFVYAINAVLSHALLAFGYSMLTSISNIAFNLVFRVLWMQLIYPQNPVFSTIPLCFTYSWIFNMIFYAIFFLFVYVRYVKKGIYKKV
jgi:putative MATE family efflux protein